MVFHFVQHGGQPGKPLGLGLQNFFLLGEDLECKGFKIADYPDFIGTGYDF